MSKMEVTGRFDPDILADQARPFVTAAQDVVSGLLVPDDYLAQAGLGLALQATVNAAVDVTGISSKDIVSAFAVAFAGWAASVADNAEEFEDAVIALMGGVRRAGPVAIADRKAT